MKVIKDAEGMDDCIFSCVECGENEYPIYCTNEYAYYQNLTELVYKKWCAIRGRAILENRRWTYSEVFDACDECCLVVVFTTKSGEEWCDPEGKYGRIWLSYYYIIEILKFVMRRPAPRKA